MQRIKSYRNRHVTGHVGRSAYRRHFQLRQKVKARREKGRNKVLFFLLIVIVSGVSLAWLGRKAYGIVTTSEKLKIKNVRIYGLETIDKQEFIKTLPGAYSENFLFSYFMNFNGYFGNKFAKIRTVRVERDFDTDAIEFHVEERTPVLAMSQKNGMQAFDEEGCRFSLAGSTATLPEVMFEGGRYSAARVKPVIGFVKYLRENELPLYCRLKSITVGDSGYLCLLLKDGSKIIWGKLSPAGPEAKIKCMEKIIAESEARFSGKKKSEGKKVLEYINLELADENRVFVKLVR